MTIKEMAKLTNKTEKTIRKWLAQEQKVLTQEQKVLTKGHQKDYDLSSVIAILKAGKISESLISLLVENAKNKNNVELIKENPTELKTMFMAFMQQQQKTNEILLEMIKGNSAKQVEYIQDYYSIIGYANNKKITISFSDALKLGKEASCLSRKLNKEIRKIPDERFGFVNSYHISILSKIFEI